MKGVGVIVFLGLLTRWNFAQFLNNRPYPTYSLEHMPDTEFSCREKILGGYYADPDTQCQMFHVCVKVAGVGVQDFRFLCPNGTAFDQDHQICADWDDVDCDATTLYYSSDNFDLYRIGSGFESKALKYGEEEEPFSLQRAETGDARVNRVHQTQQINQQKDYNTAKPLRKFNNYQNNNNNNKNNNNNEKEIFKSSSSSNFFNNRNNGKETEDDDDYENRNDNQNDDHFQKKKLRKQQGRFNSQKVEDDNKETTTPRPTFRNNFAGSSYLPTSTTSRPSSTTTGNFGGRSRQRGNSDRQYNNADNFRQNNVRKQDNPPVTHAVSSPAPFRPSQTTQFSTTPIPKPTENYPAPFTHQKKTTVADTDNYPSFGPSLQQNPPRQNYPIPQQRTTQETGSTTAVFTNTQTNYNTQTNANYNTQYEVSKVKFSSETFPTTPAKKPTNFKQTDTYPTTFSPKTFKSTTAADTLPTTFAPRTNAAYTQITQQTQFNKQNNQQTTQYYNQNTQNTGNVPNTQRETTPFVQKQTTQYNTQYTPSTNHNQFDSTRNANTQNTQTTYQQQTRQTPSYSPSTQKQTTQFTQYTPTVPRITTTPYYSPSTTPVPTSRRANRFDETQYDDGSYDNRYDNYDNSRSTKPKNNNNEEEFLKTAHSTNIASSRNEFAQNNKNIVTTTLKPRPFSVTPNSPKYTEFTKAGTTIASSPKAPHPPAQSSQSKKSNINASYDYAYYDSNAGSEPEYDIDTEIEKSNRPAKKQ